MIRSTRGAGLLVLLAACAVDERDAAPLPSEHREVATRLSAFIEDEMRRKELDAISIALVDDQTTIWSTGFGEARPGVPAGGETVHRVGSVSKLFTDIAVMQRVEAGEIDLDAPVTTYLPDFAPSNPTGEPITLRQLMSHRAGLVREPPVGNYFDDSGADLTATVASLNATRLVYPPGQRTKYSNAGIAVVGHVLERLAGEPFAEALESTVLKPIGMARSSFLPRPDLMEDLASATMWTYDGRTFEAPRFELGMAPAGSMYSTVDDLARFMAMLFDGGRATDGRILEPATLDSMWTPQFAPPGAREGYGIGFSIGELEGHRRIGHGGAIYGFATTLAALPDEKLGVAVVATTDIANTVTDRIANYALRLLLAARTGAPLPDPDSTAPLPHGLAASLEGSWEGASHAVDLVDRYGRLHLTPRDGGFRMELRARGDTLIADDRITHGMRLLHAGDVLVINDDTLRRREVRGPPPPPPASWNELIGEYGWDHNTLYILERHGQLFALIEWVFLYPLTAVQGDTWRFEETGLYPGEQLTFIRDARGMVTGLSLEGLSLPRREVGTAAGETFRITPVRPVDELRREALAATPPTDTGASREPDLVELRSLDPSIRYDIRYATTNNFMSTVFYTEPRAFLQRPAAEALLRAHQQLGEHGYGLLIHDAYRPWFVTKMFWDATPEDMKHFVADPSQGSRHNRGAAVDLTLYDLATGEVIETVGGYDEFSPRSYPDYPGGTARQRWFRERLRDAMERNGFTVYQWEWWHFDYAGWRDYPVLNERFEAMAGGE